MSIILAISSRRLHFQFCLHICKMSRLDHMIIFEVPSTPKNFGKILMPRSCPNKLNRSMGVSINFFFYNSGPRDTGLTDPSHNFFLINTLLFQSSFRFIAKLSKSTEFLYILSQNTHNLPNYQHLPPEWYICYN